MRLGVLAFLPVALFASDPILLQTGDQYTPPPAGDARKFLALICPSRIAKDKYDFEVLACQTCPKWTTDPGAGQLAARAIHYGQKDHGSAGESVQRFPSARAPTLQDNRAANQILRN